MRTLYLVGLTEDRRGLLVSDREDGAGRTFVVRTDSEAARHLLARVTGPTAGARHGSGPGALRERPRSERRRSEDAPPESALSPREIQAHLRAGRTVAEVAAEAGVSEAHIERWAAPVAHEQDAALRRALTATLDAGRRGPSALPLGGSVEANVRVRGDQVPEDRAGWSAHVSGDGSWIVRFRAEPGGPSRRLAGDAEWTLDPVTGVVAARNRAGAALGWVGPDGPKPRRASPAGAAPAARRPPAAAAPGSGQGTLPGLPVGTAGPAGGEPSAGPGAGRPAEPAAEPGPPSGPTPAAAGPALPARRRAPRRRPAP